MLGHWLLYLFIYFLLGQHSGAEKLSIQVLSHFSGDSSSAQLVFALECPLLSSELLTRSILALIHS